MLYLSNMREFITKNNNKLNLVLPTLEFNGVLVIGVVHGDEPQGEFLINEYLKCVKKTHLMFVPALNPDGMDRGTRTNLNGVDINRNFPTKNWVLSERDAYYGGESPASEVETQFAVEVIEKYSPKLIVTLHAPYKIVNYDGDALVYAEEISKRVGYPVQKDIGYPTPGSFGTYSSLEKGIPIITLELDEICDKTELIKPVFDVFEYLETLIL